MGKGHSKKTRMKHRIAYLGLTAFFTFSCNEDISVIQDEIEVSSITNTTANINISFSNSSYTELDAIGIIYGRKEQPNTFSNIDTLTSIQNQEFELDNLLPKSNYEITTFWINDGIFNIGSTSLFRTDSNETSIFIDQRDGQEYKIVKIGEQWWFAQNLNFRTHHGSYYYNNDSLNYSNQGLLYTLESALIAIPQGWRLPSQNDWFEFEKNTGMLKDMIRDSHWRGTDNYTDGLIPDGIFDFNLLWSGIKSHSRSNFYNDGSAFLWTSSSYTNQINGIDQYYCRHFFETLKTSRISIEPELSALSVRCIKN